MAEITAKMVMDLRKATGLGMMECKKALTECGGDVDAAIEALRKKGLAKAAKKADRTANEGLISIKKANDRQGVMRRVYPSRPDATGVRLWARGGQARLLSARAWRMAPAHPW